ncbi:hypothetical protein SO802_025289 [Lithocarpus litseifolius]
MRRKILEDPICERCKTEIEDSVHALWSCTELDVVWADQEQWGFRGEIDFTSVTELLSWMIGKGKPLELLAYTAYNVWNQRNKVRFNIQTCLLHQVAAQSAERLAHFRASTDASVLQVRSNVTGGATQPKILKSSELSLCASDRSSSSPFSLGENKMPLGLILGLGRAFRRKRPSSLDILSSKRAPRDYYKGKNCKPTGFHTRKGGYVVVNEKLPNYVVPDLTDFKLKPYVSQCPREVKTAEATDAAK